MGSDKNNITGVRKENRFCSRKTQLLVSIKYTVDYIHINSNYKSIQNVANIHLNYFLFHYKCQSLSNSCFPVKETIKNGFLLFFFVAFGNKAEYLPTLFALS